MKFVSKALLVLLYTSLSIFVSAADADAEVQNGGPVAIVHRSSGLCVEAKDNNINHGTAIVLSSCGRSNQKWTKIGRGVSRGYVLNSSRLSLDVVDGSVNKHAKIFISRFVEGGLNQQWTYDRISGNLKNVKSGKCLNVPHNRAAAGVQLDQHDCNGSPGLSFDKRPLDGANPAVARAAAAQVGRRAPAPAAKINVPVPQAAPAQVNVARAAPAAANLGARAPVPVSVAPHAPVANNQGARAPVQVPVARNAPVVAQVNGVRAAPAAAAPAHPAASHRAHAHAAKVHKSNQRKN